MAQKSKAPVKNSSKAAVMKTKVSAVKKPMARLEAKAIKPVKAEKTAKVDRVAKPEKPGKAVKSEKVSSARDPQIAKAKAVLKEKADLKAKTVQKKEAPVAQPELAKAEPKSKGRKISVEIDPGEAATALSGKWTSLYKKAEQIEAKPYNMKAVFEEKTAIVHKVLGWGYILANRNDRLEVLFKDGIKYLISNYKP